MPLIGCCHTRWFVDTAHEKRNDQWGSTSVDRKWPRDFVHLEQHNYQLWRSGCSAHSKRVRVFPNFIWGRESYYEWTHRHRAHLHNSYVEIWCCQLTIFLIYMFCKPVMVIKRYPDRTFVVLNLALRCREYLKKWMTSLILHVATVKERRIARLAKKNVCECSKSNCGSMKTGFPPWSRF